MPAEYPLQAGRAADKPRMGAPRIASGSVAAGSIPVVHRASIGGAGGRDVGAT
jgi:hypothetical protein